MGNPMMGNPTTSNSPMGNPMMDNPVMGNPTTGNPATGNPVMSNPTMGNPTMRNPPMGNPMMGNPATGNSAMGNPPKGNPMMGNPATGNAPMGNPAMGNPTTGHPVMGNSTMGNPAMGNPATGNPVMSKVSTYRKPRKPLKAFVQGSLCSTATTCYRHGACRDGPENCHPNPAPGRPPRGSTHTARRSAELWESRPCIFLWPSPRDLRVLHLPGAVLPDLGVLHLPGAVLPDLSLGELGQDTKRKEKDKEGKGFTGRAVPVCEPEPPQPKAERHPGKKAEPLRLVTVQWAGLRSAASPGSALMAPTPQHPQPPSPRGLPPDPHQPHAYPTTRPGTL
uniref:basic salivary proline-rich protein 1-like n=1 Tax=Nyctereutes procyonoides TaxID=34880 RepID=UPI0024441159|nr:basic salivary proline-rich protein 1-like [Nyctereutes procyonoides]